MDAGAIVCGFEPIAVDALLSDDFRMIDRLETAGGLTLRQWRQTDLEAVLAAFTSAETARQAGEPIDTAKAAQGWLQARDEEWQTDSGYSWAIVDRSGVVVGNVAITAINRRHDTG